MKKNIRADHVGSLLRPPELLQAREAHAAAKMSLAALRELEDIAILSVVQKQRELGLDIFTDGEMRRGSWLTDMAEAVEGFVSDRVTLAWKGPDGGLEASSANTVGAKLRKARTNR
jgi:5-methyltetrahydropteroyltriglutamate--homocysteine methyltransferase